MLQRLKLMNALPIHVECEHQSSLNYGSLKFSRYICVVELAGTGGVAHVWDMAMFGYNLPSNSL